ncbi:MAG: aminopeptidase, partial [Chloroflexi bacterium]
MTLKFDIDAQVEFLVGLLNTPSPTGYHVEAIGYVQER